MLTHWTHWLVLVQVIAVFTMLLGVICQKYSWIEFPGGFLIFGLSLLLLLIVGLAALIILAVAMFSSHQDWRFPSAITAVVGISPIIIIVFSLGLDKFKLPAIHDISTDLNNIPTFTAAVEARKSSDNSLAADEEVVALQKKAYSNLQPLILNQEPQQVFERALSVMGQRQWKILRQDSSAGEIEAVDETALFGFKDDVIVRITQVEEGSRIDMRSVSRVGRSDFGANYDRIKSFLNDLKE